MAKVTVKPGQSCPRSGQYAVVGPRGGIQSREVTSTSGRPMPPTQKPGQHYVLVDATKHKR